MELSVQLAGRVVAEQVVRAEVVHDAPETLRKIVLVHDRQAIGVLGKRPQRVDPR